MTSRERLLATTFVNLVDTLVDCFRSGRPVACHDLPAMRTSWPAFTEQRQGFGFRSAQALPMRLREETTGALNLFQTEPGRLSDVAGRIIEGSIGDDLLRQPRKKPGA